MQSEYSLESLNFPAFTKPNKHKTDSKDFSTTWPNLFSNTFTTVGKFKRLLQSFFSNCFSRHDGTVLTVPVTSTSARSSSPPSPIRSSDAKSYCLISYREGLGTDIFKWLYLAYYRVYLHQTWGFCKSRCALSDYVDQYLLIP